MFVYTASGGTNHELVLALGFVCMSDADGGGGSGIAGIVNDIGALFGAMNGG